MNVSEFVTQLLTESSDGFFGHFADTEKQFFEVVDSNQ